VEWARSAFEAVIGPLVVAAIITSVGLGVSAWTSITGLEFELARHTDRYAGDPVKFQSAITLCGYDRYFDLMGGLK
jgi:hypothetical protein